MPSLFGCRAETPRFDNPVISETASKMWLLISTLAVGLYVSFLKGMASSFSPLSAFHSLMVAWDTNSYVDSGKALWMAVVTPLVYLSSGSQGSGHLAFLCGLRLVASRI